MRNYNITEGEIDKNISNILEGRPLTIPLGILKRNRKFQDYLKEANKDKIAKQMEAYYEASKDRHLKKTYRKPVHTMQIVRTKNGNETSGNM